jgi:hypothetical protein
VQGCGLKGEARPSFLKKRSKKLSSIADGTAFKPENSERSEMNKSFLALFFKKELLSS